MRYLLLALFAVPLPAAVAATELTVVVPPRSIAGGIGAPLTEPRPVVNPADSNHVLVGAILAPRQDGDDWDCVVLATRDGGDTWSSRRLGIDRCIDPWLAFTGGDDVLFAGIRIARDGEGDDRLGLVLAHSTDGGDRFSAPATIGRNYEHPLLLFDGERDTLVLSRRGELGADGESRYRLELGRVPAGTLDYTVDRDIEPGAGALIGTALVADGDGVYATYRGADPDLELPAATRGHGVRLPTGEDALIVDGCAGMQSTRSVFPGYPFLAAGGGRLYHVCIAPDHRGVLFSASADGREWTAARRADRAGDDAFALTPMVAANATGGVLVAWQDRRDDPQCQRLTVVASADGGRTFGAETPLDSEPSCPANDANGRAGRSWPGGGDYSSIAVDGNGDFHVTWAAAAAGPYRLRYAVLRVR